jgi:peptidoglycan/LPS O-acetylase OafA/YrhL
MIGKYRPDIDGLRTVAILPVLLFHAGVPGLLGGFVGVDVFFVISGFLITAIIAREVDEGRFSILRFYERRIRRILPALAVVMAFVLVGAAWLFLPSDFVAVPRSIVAALLFVSNLLFWSEASYFGASAHLKPMLHSWSLAVEEQFYIFFPLLLMLVRRWSVRRRKLLLLAIFIVSLALSIVLVPRKPDFSFYMLPTRAWELMAGALLAVQAVPAVRQRFAREVVAVLGLVAILAAVVLYDETTPFPGLAALPPVLGAAALIHCAPGTLVGRLLGLRPVVFIGLISYSLYLWHWPIIVFAEYSTGSVLQGWATVAVVAASLVMATLSWRFVERPFRSSERMPAPRLFRLAGVTGAAVVAICGVAMLGHGWPGRFPPAVLALDAGRDDISPRRKDCHWDEGEGPDNHPPCVLGAATAPDTALWGDSHGVELAYALGELAAAQGKSVAQLTSSSCPPVQGIEVPGRAGCAAVNRKALAWLAAQPGIRTVVLAGYWANDAIATDPRVPGGLVQTVDALRKAGKRIVLVGAVPPNPAPVRIRLARLALRGRLAEAHGIDRATLNAKIAYLAPTLARLEKQGVTVIDPAATMCDATGCAIQQDGKSLYFDAHHLSLTGARRIAPLVAAATGR